MKPEPDEKVLLVKSIIMMAKKLESLMGGQETPDFGAGMMDDEGPKENMMEKGVEE